MAMHFAALSYAELTSSSDVVGDNQCPSCTYGCPPPAFLTFEGHHLCCEDEGVIVAVHGFLPHDGHDGAG